jgi:hypothetical protein
MTIEERFLEKHKEILSLAKKKFPYLNIKDIPVKFNIHSKKTLGDFNYKVNDGYLNDCYIRYNIEIANGDEEIIVDLLENTVPHEIAHYVTRLKYINHVISDNIVPFSSRRWRVHGDEWKDTCIALGLEDPKRCRNIKGIN